MNLPPLVTETVASHPHPLLFATISGAHLYGFPSPDSDFDIRGVHILPPREVLGLIRGEETIETMLAGPPEVDLVTHDVEKFMRLMLKKNGYVLEQLLSPLVVLTTPEHAELRELARDCITRFHVHHYLGFSESQWRLFEKEHPRRVKPLLYVFRVLLTGIHLMRTGEIDANLPRLNEEFRLTYLDELIAIKTSGHEQQTAIACAARVGSGTNDVTRGVEREGGIARAVVARARHVAPFPDHDANIAANGRPSNADRAHTIRPFRVRCHSATSVVAGAGAVVSISMKIAAWSPSPMIVLMSSRVTICISPVSVVM
jgi:predicted nucleotidyltransferase